jgi:hypothetical protein
MLCGSTLYVNMMKMRRGFLGLIWDVAVFSYEKVYIFSLNYNIFEKT